MTGSPAFQSYRPSTLVSTARLSCLLPLARSVYLLHRGLQRALFPFLRCRLNRTHALVDLSMSDTLHDIEHKLLSNIFPPAVPFREDDPTTRSASGNEKDVKTSPETRGVVWTAFSVPLPDGREISTVRLVRPVGPGGGRPIC